jgi:hypothetical protein
MSNKNSFLAALSTLPPGASITVTMPAAAPKKRKRPAADAAGTTAAATAAAAATEKPARPPRKRAAKKPAEPGAKKPTGHVHDGSVLCKCPEGAALYYATHPKERGKNKAAA